MNKNIDYSNTIIYKICCKDPSITDLYVGHTTNFFTRKQSHRNCCNNQKNYSYNSKLYTCIRENGGWENWDIIEIAKHNLNNFEEARMKEQEYYEKLQANLNSCPPYIKPKEIISKQSEKNYDKTQKYTCEKCEYSTNIKSSFDKHELTMKHKKINNLENTNILDIENNNKLKCLCGNTYNFKQSLCVHRKNCSLYINCKNNDILCSITNNLSNDNNTLKNIIIKLINTNTELQNKINKLQLEILSINNKENHIK